MEKLLSNLKTLDISQIISTYILPWGKNILFAILIFFIGKIIAKLIKNIAMKVISKSIKDEMLINFVSSILGGLLLLFVIIASLSQLGVDTNSLVALIGAAGLAIGLSLQDSLKNFAAGVMILAFRPFSKGEYVEVTGSKEAGTVKKINIFTMTINTTDNKEIIIPNASVLSDPIINYSRMPNRRVDMVFGIGYNDNIKDAKDIIQNILENNSQVLKDPKPQIAVSELGDNSVNFVVRPWANTPDYWEVYFATHESVKIAFDKAGISIPYPQMDVYMKKADQTV